MSNPSPLDDPAYARFAWARWKRMMRVMALVTAISVALILAYFWFALPGVPIHLYIAVALGVSVTMLLTSALMGLMFLSNGSGHDAAVSDSPQETRRR